MRPTIRGIPALVALVLGLSTGCTKSTLVSHGPISAAGEHSVTSPNVTRYHLAKTIVIVDAKVTYRTTADIEFQKDDIAKTHNFKIKLGLKPIRSSAQVTVATIPDQDTFYTLELVPGDGDNSELGLEMHPSGLLKGINVKSTSQAGEILKSTLQVASVVGPLLLMALGEDTQQKLNAVERVCSRFMNVDSDDIVDQCKALSASNKALADSIKPLSMRALYFLANDPEGRRLWQRRLELDDVLAKLAKERQSKEGGAASAPKGEIDVLKGQLALILSAIENATAERTRIVSALDTLIQKFEKTAHLDGREYEQTFKTVLDLDKLPATGVVTDGMDSVNVANALSKHAEMKALFDAASIVVTADAPPLAASLGQQSPSEGDSSAQIYYRKAYLSKITTFGVGPTIVGISPGEDPKLVMRRQDEKIETVVGPKSAILSFSFEPEQFAERKLELAFDERGQPLKVVRSDTSVIAGATGAIASGVTQVRDQYADTLDKLGAIDDAKRKLQQADITAEIERLKNEKALIDARLELTGAQANGEAIAEKKRIDAQIELLKSQKALAQERSSEP